MRSALIKLLEKLVFWNVIQSDQKLLDMPEQGYFINCYGGFSIFSVCNFDEGHHVA